MNWKVFLKPNLLKLTMFVILFAFFTFLPTGFIKNIFEPFPQINQLGFPLNFFDKSCSATDVLGGSTHCSNQIYYVKLSLDIIFWYVLSAGIVLLFTKEK